MKKPTYSLKVLELVAKAVGESFTGPKIVQMLEAQGIPRYEINYPNTKWRTAYEIFEKIKKEKPEADDIISKIIMEFLHPLNHGADEEKAKKLDAEVEKYLKYDNYCTIDTGTEFLVMPREEADEIHGVTPADLRVKKEKDGTEKIKDIEKIKTSKDLITILRDSHQMYIDVLESFCRNIKKPTKDLNDAYIYLTKKIRKAVQELNLQHYKIIPYIPFHGDLYSAEAQWDGTDELMDMRFGPKLSWDAIRPSLNQVHSKITELYYLAHEDTDLTDDERELEKIAGLISKQRAEQVLPKRDKVIKMEVLNKYEKPEEKPKLKLSEHKISFDDETAQLHVGDFQTVLFPSHKNEHYVLRKLFSAKRGEAIDWQDVYETVTRTKSETLDGKEIEKQKKMIKDAVNAINTRVRETCNTESDLLKWETKCVKRLY